jgi:ribosomal RNA-processing protein 8
MASKIFQETDSWGDSSGNSNSVDFTFHKTPKVKVKKEKKAKKRKIIEETETNEIPGRYVRPPNWNFNTNLSESEESPQIINKTDRKRKHHETEALNGQSSDGITPEKKSKQQDEIQKPERPKTFGDKLRDSLKGSRFRFLNEQMYKQTGDESLKVFSEDPEAFEAYHEGYRHQIANWPMNPLDRMINNVKRL